MQSMSYAEFLASKERRHSSTGPTVDADAVSPVLHDWQQAIVQWACVTGRAAIFADCGLGKTFMQLEWARLVTDTTLIFAPLSVARQTAREASKIDQTVQYVRSSEEVNGPGVWITNYELAHRFDPDRFGAVVLDESSILKNHTGHTRNALIAQWAKVPYRLACTATPAPNDVAELANHAEFLGAMPRNEMLAAFFVHDEIGWRPKGHAVGPMYKWMATWSAALRTPSDIGYSDDGYILPPLRIHAEIVHVELQPEGQLFATDLGGIGGRSTVRRATLDARVKRAARLVDNDDDQWIVWCGLNDEADVLHDMLGDQSINVAGSWSPEAKAETLEAFQDGAIRVLITKPSIAGFGMNFQNAHRMAFVGLSDSYEAYYQAIRRCWRFGQQEPVDVHIIVSELEQQIVDNVRHKEAEAAVTASELVRYSPIRKDTDERTATAPAKRRERRMLASTKRR